jgi:hypothetical protein
VKISQNGWCWVPEVGKSAYLKYALSIGVFYNIIHPSASSFFFGYLFVLDASSQLWQRPAYWVICFKKISIRNVLQFCWLGQYPNHPGNSKSQKSTPLSQTELKEKPMLIPNGKHSKISLSDLKDCLARSRAMSKADASAVYIEASGLSFCCFFFFFFGLMDVLLQHLHRYKI